MMKNGHYSGNDLYYPFGVIPTICGCRAHVMRFAAEVLARGWRIWGPPADRFGADAGMIPLPAAWPARIRVLRNVRVVYARIEDRIDWTHFSRFACRPWKRLVGSPLVAWEFNTVPEYGRLQGWSEADVDRRLAEMRRLARDCDVAFCVSEKIAAYVATHLGIRDVVVTPNGSDPGRFTPEAPTVRYLDEGEDVLRVVWMGGGDIAWHDFDLLRDMADLLWRRGYGERIRFFVISGRCPGIGAMPPNVLCVGQQPYEELPGWLSGMDVGLCLYRSGPADYSSPLKLYDYMAAGLAVLSTRQPQTVSVLDAAGLDRSVMTRPDEFADALAAYARDRATAQRHGATLRKLLLDRHTWRHTVARILDEIDQRL